MKYFLKSSSIFNQAAGVYIQHSDCTAPSVPYSYEHCINNVQQANIAIENLQTPDKRIDSTTKLPHCRIPFYIGLSALQQSSV